MPALKKRSRLQSCGRTCPDIGLPNSAPPHFPLSIDRRLRSTRLLCILFAWLAVSVGFGQSPTVSTPSELSGLTRPTSLEPALLEALARKGSVTFKDTPLGEVILILSAQWDVNIVAGSEVNRTVSGNFRNESLEKILDSLLTANGYNYRQIGKSLVVLDAGDATGGKPTFQVEVIDAPTTNTQELGELIEALRLEMSPEGQIQAINVAGKLAIHDTPERIDAVKRLLAKIVGHDTASSPSDNYVSSDSRDSLTLGGVPSGPGQPGISPSPQSPADPRSVTGALEIRPQFMVVDDLKEPIEMIIGEGTVSIVEEENLLVIIGDEPTHEKVRALMRQLDRPRPQVRITGYIYDVDLGEIERLGIDWNNRTMSQAVGPNGAPRNVALSQSGLLLPNAPNNATQIVTGVAEEAASATATAAAGAASAAAAATDPTGGQFLFRTLNSNVEFQALVQALDQTEGSRLLADPHVTVVDRHTASLGIVTQIPVQQLTQTQQGGSIGTTTFQEAGITLDVTPRIADDGTIEMEVSPEFSVLSGFQSGNPIIDTRRASTVVRVTHGESLVIGGLRSKSTVETVRGIPGLMNVKWFGKLFRSHTTDVRESELIVLIMPEIIGYCGGLAREMHALDVTQQQLSRIQTAVDGPFTPDCKDKHCPHHCERPRIHNGMHDAGLIGAHDTPFLTPAPALNYEPVDVTPPQPVDVSVPSLEDVSARHQRPPVAFAEQLQLSDPPRSSRRVPARTASFQR